MLATSKCKKTSPKTPAKSFTPLTFDSLEQVYLGNNDPFFLTEENISILNRSNSRQGGTYYSVIGGLAGLNYIQHLEPDKVVLFDINPNAVTFARLFLAILQRSATRIEFLRNFFCRNLPEDISLSNQKEFLSKPASIKIRKQIANDLPENLRTFYEVFFESALVNPLKVKDSDVCDQLLPCWPIHNYVPIQYVRAPSVNTLFWGHGWLEDEESFRHTKRLLVDAKAIHSNLVKLHPYDASAIYVSNVDTFIPDITWHRFLGSLRIKESNCYVISSDKIEGINCQLAKRKKLYLQRAHNAVIGCYRENYAALLVNFYKRLKRKVSALVIARKNPHSEALKRISPLVEVPVLEVTTRKKWGFLELNDRDEVHVSNLTRTNLHMYKTILFHNLVGEGLEISEWLLLLDYVNKHPGKKLIILEHNGDSSAFSDNTCLLILEKIQKALKDRHLEFVGEQLAPGCRQKDRNLIVQAKTKPHLEPTRIDYYIPY